MSSNKKHTVYSLKEVEQHNTETDAWVSIHGSVYDITEWIPKHPGGYIIMNAIGTDATELFESIGHPDRVKNEILPRYKIGILKK